MFKKELIVKLSGPDYLGMPIRTTEAVLSTVIRAFEDVLISGEQLKIGGILTITPVFEKAHTWLNNFTGENYFVPDRMKLECVFHRNFKDRLSKEILGESAQPQVVPGERGKSK